MEPDEPAMHGRAAAARRGLGPDRLGGRVLLALVDLSTSGASRGTRELLEAAHLASRRGTIAVVVPAGERPGVEALLADIVARAGLGPLGVRLVDRTDRAAFLSEVSRIDLVVFEDGALAAGSDGSMELIQRGEGIARLRALGRSPSLRAADSVFAPLRSR